MKMEQQNQTVQVFVASSLDKDDFKNKRLKLGELFDRMEKNLHVHIFWPRPETTFSFLRLEGSQSVFNQYVQESDFVFLIVGKHMGKYTLEEFNVAWEQFSKTGKPLIRPYFLLPGGIFPDKSVINFRDKLHNLHYYTDTKSSFEEIEADIQSILTTYFIQPPDNVATPDEGEHVYQEEPKNAKGSGGGEQEDDGNKVWGQNGFLRCLKALQGGSLNYPEIERICYKGREMVKKRANPELTLRAREEALEEFEKALEQSIDRLKQDKDNENTHEFNERLGALMELQKALWNDPPPTA